MKTSLLDLPLEILLHIIDYSRGPLTWRFGEPPTLARLRASCRRLKTLIDPIRWHTVCIYPHVDHFEQMRSLSACGSITQHVRFVVYDLQWLGTYNEIANMIETHWNMKNGLERKHLLLERVEKARDGIIEASRDQDFEMMFLRDILRSFPLLESCNVLDVLGPPGTQEEAPDYHIMPRFYQLQAEDLDLYWFSESTSWISGMCVRYATSHRPEQRSRKVLGIVLTSIEKLQRLSIKMGLWSDFIGYVWHRKEFTVMARRIQNLKSLTLHATLEKYTKAMLDSLAMVLEHGTSLENLDLGFNIRRHDTLLQTHGPDDEDNTDDYSHYHFSTLQPLLSESESGPTVFGKGLRRLALSGIRCRHSEIRKLLDRAAPTLRALKLEDVQLIREMTPSGQSQQAPDVLQFFEDLRSMLRLDSIKLAGDFCATTRQRYFSQPEKLLYRCQWCYNCMRRRPPGPCTEQRLPDAEPPLLERMMNWILRLGPCPLEGLYIQPGEDDVTKVQSKRYLDRDDPSFKILGLRHNPFDEDSDDEVDEGDSSVIWYLPDATQVTSESLWGPNVITFADLS
jgi:hypothetical protein